MAEIFKVHELLATGRDNARTGRELADALGCNIRHVTLAIEEERREGFPICATSDAEELEAYRKKLSKREHELHRTGEALAQCQI